MYVPLGSVVQPVLGKVEGAADALHGTTEKRGIGVAQDDRIDVFRRVTSAIKEHQGRAADDEDLATCGQRFELLGEREQGASDVIAREHANLGLDEPDEVGEGPAPMMGEGKPRFKPNWLTCSAVRSGGVKRTEVERLPSFVTAP